MLRRHGQHRLLLFLQRCFSDIKPRAHGLQLQRENQPHVYAARHVHQDKQFLEVLSHTLFQTKWISMPYFRPNGFPYTISDQMDSHTLFQTKWISIYYFRPDGGTINRLISLLHLLFIVTSCYFHFVNFPRCFFHYVIFEICDHTYCINDNPNQNEAYTYAQQYFKPKGTTMSLPPPTPPHPSPTWNALKYSLWVCSISFTSPCRFLMCWSLVCMEVCNTVMCCCWLD